jgi:hypothetical protein
MKTLKIIIGFALVLNLNTLYAQTTATDFTANDCNGVSHNLFSELDSGKVIVIAWVMPCLTCITDPLAAFAEVQNYSVSNPDKVRFYMVDDYANTSCSTLSSWAVNYGMDNCIKFSDPSISMSDYGVNGMPKIVVMAGLDHKIYFNKNSSHQGIEAAISQAINSTGLNESYNSKIKSKIYPNPSKDILNIEFTEGNSSNVKVEIINILGEVIFTLNTNQLISENNLNIDINSLKNGVYILKTSSKLTEDSKTFIVSK